MAAVVDPSFLSLVLGVVSSALMQTTLCRLCFLFPMASLNSIQFLNENWAPDALSLP